MKILIVNNGTKHLEQLQDLLPRGTVHTTVAFSEIDKDKAESFDLTILSGGYSFPVLGNEEKLKKEIAFITHYKKPIFGICFGFELIAFTFGAQLERMEKKERGILTVEVLEPDSIFLNISHFDVFEAHRWVVKELGSTCIALAKSKDGIEAIKHKTRPMYAVQFHPEMFVDKTCGDEIFRNFLEIIQ